jgi:hypothetical protein
MASGDGTATGYLKVEPEGVKPKIGRGRRTGSAVPALNLPNMTSLQIESARLDGGEGICAILLYQVLQACSSAWMYLPPSQS